MLLPCRRGGGRLVGRADGLEPPRAREGSGRSVLVLRRRRIKTIRKKGRSRLRSQINFLAYFRQFSINEFLLKDRCALPDQMSSVFTFSRRRFILAMRDGDGANKNKIAVFDFGVTPKHFPHDMLLNDHRSPRSALGAVLIYRLDWVVMGI